MFVSLLGKTVSNDLPGRSLCMSVYEYVCVHVVYEYVGVHVVAFTHMYVFFCVSMCASTWTPLVTQSVRTYARGTCEPTSITPTRQNAHRIQQLSYLMCLSLYPSCSAKRCSRSCCTCSIFDTHTHTTRLYPHLQFGFVKFRRRRVRIESETKAHLVHSTAVSVNPLPHDHKHKCTDAHTSCRANTCTHSHISPMHTQGWVCYVAGHVLGDYITSGSEAVSKLQRERLGSAW